VRDGIIVVPDTIRATIARGCKKNMVSVTRRSNGIVQRLRSPAATPAVVGYLCTHLYRIVQRRNAVRGVATLWANETERHDFALFNHPRDSEAVVCYRAYRACDVGAMAVLINWVIVFAR